MKNYLFFKVLICISILFCFGCSENANDDWYVDYMQLNYINSKYKGKNQKIAIIDSGLSIEYQNFYSNQIIYKYNCIDGNDDISDENGHGTEMTLLILGDEERNIKGISPKSDVIILKVVDENGKTNSNLLLNALVKAEQQNADVVNMSLGTYKENESIAKQIKKMNNKNITIVSSVGDDGNKDILFPSSLESVIAVTALDKNSNIYEESNTSDKKSIAFPGVEIKPLNFGEEENITGTSYACAIATGYISLLKEHYKKNKIRYDNDYILKQLERLNNLDHDKIDYKKLFD